jgi:hypothetical protein
VSLPEEQARQRKAPSESKKDIGDIASIIFGLGLQLVLRPENGHYFLVAERYVHNHGWPNVEEFIRQWTGRKKSAGFLNGIKQVLQRNDKSNLM